MARNLTREHRKVVSDSELPATLRKKRQQDQEKVLVQIDSKTWVYMSKSEIKQKTEQYKKLLKITKNNIK